MNQYAEEPPEPEMASNMNPFSRAKCPGGRAEFVLDRWDDMSKAGVSPTTDTLNLVLTCASDDLKSMSAGDEEQAKELCARLVVFFEAMRKESGRAGADVVVDVLHFEQVLQVVSDYGELTQVEQYSDQMAKCLF
jgi:hypothetical protein